ncbi:MAG: class I SAM-dependent methyltransferase [Planctomycetota bacterium]|nr:MAG: class I SAM-dependent methyltransferase [Planctomycetota bacterium]
MKSTVQQIRERFDQDVERFARLEAGQSATMDAPLVLDLIAGTVAALHPQAQVMLDVGCGAGNYSLKVLQRLPDLDVTLIDLSRPMLERARERVSQATRGSVAAIQGDIRAIQLTNGKFDIILAAAVLHHLRADQEWESVFAKLHAALRPGGSLWIADLIQHDEPAIQALMWQRYGDYLMQLKDEAYRDHVFAYVEREDTPRSLLFQIDLLRNVGFRHIEVLHKHCCFAAFGAIK